MDRRAARPGWQAVCAWCVPWLLAAAGPAHAACGDDLPLNYRMEARSGEMRVLFTPSPAPIPVGRHFSLDIAVCRGDAPAQAAQLKLDADMPAHRHGMNYRPSLRAIGPGRYQAQGYLFHMPGSWRFIFDVADGGASVRATRETVVE